MPLQIAPARVGRSSSISERLYLARGGILHPMQEFDPLPRPVKCVRLSYCVDGWTARTCYGRRPLRQSGIIGIGIGDDRRAGARARPPAQSENYGTLFRERSAGAPGASIPPRTGAGSTPPTSPRAGVVAIKQLRAGTIPGPGLAVAGMDTLTLKILAVSGGIVIQPCHCSGKAPPMGIAAP